MSGCRRESESLIVKDEIENRGVTVNSSAMFGCFVFPNLLGHFDFNSTAFLLLLSWFFNFFFFRNSSP